MSASAVLSVVDLPEPVRPGDEQRADGTFDEELELHLHLIREAEIRERRRRAQLAEQAHDDSFAVHGRENRNPHVDRPIGRGSNCKTVHPAVGAVRRHRARPSP